MSKQIKVKKVVITGGAGYIGNELIKALPASIEIVVIDNFHIDTPHKRKVNTMLQKNRPVKVIRANVADVKKYKKYLYDADVVVYMASLNSYAESNENPLFYLQENVVNLQKFLNALSQHAPGIKKLIVTSTRGVYGEGAYLCEECDVRVYPTFAEKIRCTECWGVRLIPQPIKESDKVNPTSMYGLSKKMQEDLLSLYSAQKNILLDIFRIFNVYGEEQGKYYSSIGIIPKIYNQITTKKEMFLSGNGKVARDFVHVADVVRVLSDAILCKNSRKKYQEIYNVGSGMSVTIGDISLFFESLGFSFKKKKIKHFNDVKYSVAENERLSKTFNIKSFHDIYSFMTKSYKQTI